MGQTISSLASVGMAIGPPAVYVDQYISIVRKRDSTGFSRDVPGVLILANITRIYFWLSKRFEVALLVQSILLIVTQLALLYVCIKYSHREDDAGPHEEAIEGSKSAETRLLGQLQAGGSVMKRPLRLWQWASYGPYIEFVAGYIFLIGLLYLALHQFQIFVDILGFWALGLESTLPIPQLITNFRRKSLAGFSRLVLAGWLGGDAFKTVYFFVKNDNALQFRVCAIFQLSVDFLILLQAYLYRHNTHLERLALNDDQEEEAFQAAKAARAQDEEQGN